MCLLCVVATLPRLRHTVLWRHCTTQLPASVGVASDPCVCVSESPVDPVGVAVCGDSSHRPRASAALLPLLPAPAHSHDAEAVAEAVPVAVAVAGKVAGE